MSQNDSQTSQKPPTVPTSNPPPPVQKATSLQTSAGAQKESEAPIFFHFAECTNCRHILPISTTTEKYFAILTKDPDKAVGLGEKCMRCGADSWKIITG